MQWYLDATLNLDTTLNLQNGCCLTYHNNHMEIYFHAVAAAKEKSWHGKWDWRSRFSSFNRMS